MLTFIVSEYYTKSKGGEKCDKNYKSNVMSEPKAENQTV
jgi:hypothetical protein